jgi:hypothetical protein
MRTSLNLGTVLLSVCLVHYFGLYAAAGVVGYVLIIDWFLQRVGK